MFFFLANKQLVFGTYGNAISILEEFERREMEKLKHGHHMPKSNIPIPNQSHKTFEDVRNCTILHYTFL